jgi:alpha-tubulin suppressor-like RCC1 family protein
VTSTDSQCWGDNDWGQIGNGQAGDKLTRLIQASPVAVSTTTVFTQLAGGGTHTCGLTTTGTVQCWGRGLEGQLGTGAFMYQSVVPANSLL